MAYERPQPHACFIQSVSDDLVNDGGIMDLWVREARLFKYGSGTGTNFSNLRGENESLSGGGKSSGLMSFLKIGDRAAGAIKSGGTTRSTYHVAPLVGPDWQPSDPIHAWVTCSPGFPMGCKQFPSRAPIGMTPPGFQSSGFETAVQQACAKQSLNCPKAHLLLEAVPSIEAGVADERNAGFRSPVIGFFSWAVPRVLLDLYRLAAALLGALFRRRDDEPPAPPKP